MHSSCKCKPLCTVYCALRCARVHAVYRFVNGKIAAYKCVYSSGVYTHSSYLIEPQWYSYTAHMDTIGFSAAPAAAAVCIQCTIVDRLKITVAQTNHWERQCDNELEITSTTTTTAPAKTLLGMCLWFVIVRLTAKLRPLAWSNCENP